MCSLRMLGRDVFGKSRFRFKCTPASTSFAANALGPWMIDGIAGGNSTLGTISGPELVDYKAPEQVPSPDTVIASTQVTASDGTISAPLKMRIRIVPAGLAYSGRYDFTQVYGGDLTITGKHSNPAFGMDFNANRGNRIRFSNSRAKRFVQPNFHPALRYAIDPHNVTPDRHSKKSTSIA